MDKGIVALIFIRKWNERQKSRWRFHSDCGLGPHSTSRQKEQSARRAKINQSPGRKPKRDQRTEKRDTKQDGNRPKPNAKKGSTCYWDIDGHGYEEKSKLENASSTKRKKKASARKDELNSERPEALNKKEHTNVNTKCPGKALLPSLPKKQQGGKKEIPIG